MSLLDWIVLIVTLVGIILYGLYKSRSEKNLESYFLMNRSSSWYLILLSIIGTQASAVTFLSAPGQAYTDGMRFVQYYFGLPLAMVVLCITFVPVFHRLKLFTVYEFLEKGLTVKQGLLLRYYFYCKEDCLRESVFPRRLSFFLRCWDGIFYGQTF
jgi:Na+/proline symporter